MKPNASRGYGDFFPFLIKVGRANAGPFFLIKRCGRRMLCHLVDYLGFHVPNYKIVLTFWDN